MTDVEKLAAFLLEPTPLMIIVTVLVVISVPLFLHFVIYRSASSTALPSFLLVGPSGTGKTSLLTLFERGSAASTRPSQTALTVECSLPTSNRARSSTYRSEHDPSSLTHQKFLLADTPGHGKLRHLALDQVINPQNLHGIIFVVDAADLSSSSSLDGDSTSGETLRQTAEYLHDLLLMLQKRSESAKSNRKGPKTPAVLIAANKMDLFTAFPATLVKNTLEAEITHVRNSRHKGLLDSGVGMDEGGGERDWLGEEGEKKFAFSQMGEFGVEVSVRGGNVVGADKPDVKEWWKWIADYL